MANGKAPKVFPVVMFIMDYVSQKIHVYKGDVDLKTLRQLENLDDKHLQHKYGKTVEKLKDKWIPDLSYNQPESINDLIYVPIESLTIEPKTTVIRFWYAF